MAETKIDKLDQILGKLGEHDKRFDVVIDELRSKHNLVMSRMNDLDKRQLDTAKSIRLDIQNLDSSLRAVHYDVKELDKKLDMHVSQPAH